MVRRMWLLLAVIALGVPVFAQATEALRVGGVLRLPLRVTIEGLGGTVRQNPGAGTWMVRLHDRAAVIDFAAMIAMSGGREVKLPAPPVWRGNSVLLPAQFLVDELGVQVNVDEAKRVVVARRETGDPVEIPLLAERIVCAAGGAICALDPDGANLVRLTPVRPGTGSPVVSPRGDLIAYLVGTEVRVVKADGSGDRAVVSGTLPIFCLQFSPDGSRLLFVRNGEASNAMVISRGDLVLVNVDGTGERKLTASEADETCAMPSFNHDGSKIAYVFGKGDRVWPYVINADGTGRARLSARADEVGICTAVAPPGGPFAGRVWYVLARGADLTGAVRIVDMAGKNEVAPAIFPTTGPRPTLINGIHFAPDGTRVLLEATYPVAGKPGQFQDDLVVAGADGANPRRLTNMGGITPSFSPDGTRVVYVNNDLLHIVGVDGTGYTKLTRTGTYASPRWVLLR